MSHQESGVFIPWPSFPPPLGEEAYEYNSSPSDPAAIDMWRGVIAARFPDGLPVPADWEEADVHFNWSVDGSLVLSVSRKIQHRGENPEEPEVSRGFRREFSVDDCGDEAAIARLLAGARAWRSGWTPKEQAMHTHLDGLRKRIQVWLNSAPARTIPFLADGGRVNIAQAAEAVAFELYFHPTAPLPAHIERARQEVVAAVEQYPVAAPGLRELCKELGVPLS